MADDQNQTTNGNAKVDEDTFVSDQQVSNKIPPSIQGEQSVSGSEPDPGSDDDTLKNAHQAGEQVDEDLEHPKELDLSRDIDKAEEQIRTH